MRIGLISDIHFGLEEEPAAASPAAAELRSCLSHFNRCRPDFVLQLGDLINGSDNAAADELRLACRIFDTCKGTIRHVIGNHDLAVPRDELLLTLGLQCAYYRFTVGSYRFIVLDGMDISVHNEPETPSDREIFDKALAEPSMHDYCGAVGERQREWLCSSLQAASDNGEPVIVVCHFPLHPATTDPKHGLLWNHREIREILAAYPAVKASLGGHFHHGGHTRENGMHYIVLPAFINRTEHPGYACAVAELHPDRLVISGNDNAVMYNLALT
ncbi:metallophosphoesterase [Chlorobium limicola]